MSAGKDEGKDCSVVEEEEEGGREVGRKQVCKASACAWVVSVALSGGHACRIARMRPRAAWPLISEGTDVAPRKETVELRREEKRLWDEDEEGEWLLLLTSS